MRWENLFDSLGDIEKLFVRRRFVSIGGVFRVRFFFFIFGEVMLRFVIFGFFFFGKCIINFFM